MEDDWIVNMVSILLGLLIIGMVVLIIYAAATYERPATQLYQECIELLKDSEKCKILLPEVKPDK